MARLLAGRGRSTNERESSRPDYPNLLAAGRDPIAGGWVRKPLLGREGASVSIRARGIEVDSEGPYSDSGFVYQAYAELGEHDASAR